MIGAIFVTISKPFPSFCKRGQFNKKQINFKPISEYANKIVTFFINS